LGPAKRGSKRVARRRQGNHATVGNLKDGTTYFFTVTAINTAGLESEPSNEVSHTTPSRPPEIYTLTVIRGSGSGPYPPGIWVPVHAEAPGRGEQFAHWDGDTQILKSPRTDEDNEAFTISRDVTITAVYSALPSFTVTVTNGTGDGSYFAGDTVQVGADAASSEQFTGWTGNAAFSDPLSPTTTFTMPAVDVIVTATYRVADQIRYYPRSGFLGRMIGGVFEGTNDDPLSGTYTQIYAITTTPPLAWTTANANLGNYRYLRYRGPNGSHGNVAEIKFYRDGMKINGTAYGTSGSWRDQGNTFQKALDGDVNTYFDGPTAGGNYVGIDRGAASP
jgi:Divergent InlB B-repeat domain